MHKVISINLNGNAYQLEDGGFEALRLYLDRAERQLEGNPDRAEIMADLEQAIADKCRKHLGPHKTVVTTAEVEAIIAEMGPVDGAAGEDAESAGTAPGSDSKTGDTKEPPPKRLYRVPAGSMIAGVCTGLATYFNVDVTIVRIGFVAAALLTKGAAIIAYVVMMFVVPEASTPEARAAAGDAPFNARDVIERARARSTETGREFRRKWARQRREWQRQWRPGASIAVAPPPLVAVLLPVFGLAQMALFIVTMAMLISLVNTGAILDWELPPDVPVWAAALILLIGYQIVVSPMRAARHWSWPPAGAAEVAPLAFWNAIAWLIGVAFSIWLASNHIPEIAEFLRRLPDLFRDFAWAMRDLVQR